MIFRDVVGYEAFYEVSDEGGVKSKDRITLRDNRHGKQLTKIKGRSMRLGERNGYKYVNLCINDQRKKVYVHRLVAQAFIPNPNNKTQVNHKDGNKINNCVNNLEWCTPAENMKHAHSIGLMNPPKGVDHWITRKKLEEELEKYL